MDPERWRRVEQLYHSALDRSPSDRKAFLAEVCAWDADLQQQVEILLAQGGPTEALVDKRPWRAATELTYGRTILQPGVRLGPYELFTLLGLCNSLDGAARDARQTGNLGSLMTGLEQDFDFVPP